MKRELSALILAFSVSGCPYPEENGNFTPEELAESESLVRGEWTESIAEEVKSVAGEVDEANYRFKLPTFERDRIVGTEIVGTLPITEIRRVAAFRGVTYDEQANAQAVIWTSCSGGGVPPMGTCASDHSASASGHDIGERVRSILANIDQSLYFYLN